jgi:hypothetical protein
MGSLFSDLIEYSRKIGSIQQQPVSSASETSFNTKIVRDYMGVQALIRSYQVYNLL